MYSRCDANKETTIQQVTQIFSGTIKRGVAEASESCSSVIPIDYLELFAAAVARVALPLTAVLTGLQQVQWLTVVFVLHSAAGTKEK